MAEPTLVVVDRPASLDWPGLPLEQAWRQLPAQWRTTRWPVTTAPFQAVFRRSPTRQLADDLLDLDLGGFPDRVGKEVAWFVWRSWRDGDRKLDPLWLRRWAQVATEWQQRRLAAGLPAAASVLDIPPADLERLWAERFYRRHRRLPQAATARELAQLIEALVRAVDVWFGGRPWWQHDSWSLLHDPRIPRREHEPGLDLPLPIGSYGPAWLREGLRFWLRTSLTCQAMSWGTARQHASNVGNWLGGFVTRIGIANPALVAEPDRQLRPLMLGFLEELRTRPSEHTGRVVTPSTRGYVQVAVSNFYRFAYDHRHELAEVTGDRGWTLVSAHHTRLWPAEFRPGGRTVRSRHRVDPFIGDADLSRMVAGIELLGLPRDQTREAVINGHRTRVRGLGDPQNMRAWLIQALTGRRANEILKLSFRPYVLLDGLDLEQASEDDFVARLTYAQSKVEGVDPTILIERAVVNVIQEQQRWLLDVLGCRDHQPDGDRDGEPAFLFITTMRNHRGRLPRSLRGYHEALKRLDRLLRLTDSAGEPLRYAVTHRLRHTKATALLNSGVPVHVMQRYLGHLSPEMCMRYSATLAKTAEAEFLRYKKVGRDGRDIPISPRDLYELAELDKRTDRVLPNGLCMLPPTKRCERGNACLPCDFYATDKTHLGELCHQQTATLTLITKRKRQHQERTGTQMTDDNVWLQGRMTELRSLGAIIKRLEEDDIALASEPIVVRGAGVSGRPGYQDQAAVDAEATPDAVRRSLKRHPEAEDGTP